MVDNMEWFNVFGLIFTAVIMMQCCMLRLSAKMVDNTWNNKYVEVTEQVGRLGLFQFMIINIPELGSGGGLANAHLLYLIVDTILVMLYCAIWIMYFKKNSVFQSIAFLLFLQCCSYLVGYGRSVLLIIASVLFAPSHIVISYKNVK